MNLKQTKRAVLSAIMAVTCAISCLSIPAVPVMAATGDVEINSTNFSDSYFREYVKTFDTNKDGKLSSAERSAVTEIKIRNNTTIKSLSGIKNFPKLKKLDAYKSKISYSVDLSLNTEIEYIDLELAPVSSINISNCKNITHLDLFGTDISYVDVSICPNLIYLDLSGTKMNVVNIIHLSSILNTYNSNNAKSATYSNISVIGHGDYKSGYYFSYNPNARVISSCPTDYIDYNSSEYVSLEQSDRFRYYDEDKDGLISPDENKKITAITLSSYKGDSLEIFKNFPYITHFEIMFGSDITSFDGTCFPNLESLFVLFSDSITSVDISKNPNLKMLFIFDCENIASIDISNNTSIKALQIRETGIKTIDISNNQYLLNAYFNPDEHVVDEEEGYDFRKIGDDSDPYGIYVDIDMTIITDKPVTPTNPSAPGGSTTPVAPSAPETGLAGFIERLYNVALGRASEAQGKNWWINKVKFENYTGSDVATGFLFSDEFLGKQMTNDQFLEVLYKTFFNRASDAQGKSYWLNQMNGGYSKTDVINGFCNSTEWANLCLTYGIPSGSSAAPTIVITPNEGTNAFVTRLYTTCLGRAPEAAGFEYWTYRLANMQERGSSAAYGFFTSPEFTGKGYDNATYVTLLYRTILEREPDQAGLNYWLNLMANGMNRVDVLNGFAASTEWADICSSYGILK